MAMDKVFKGILQYKSTDTFTKKPGYIYFVREFVEGKATDNAEVWFGTRKYGNVEATKLADLTQRLETAEGDITTIKGQIGEWLSNIGTIATVVSGHDTKIKSLEGVVATKAAQSDLNALTGRVGTAETDIDNLEIAVGAGFSESKTVASEIARVEGIADAAQTAQEVSDAIDAKIADLNSASHTHDNKALLDTYTQTEADLADAVSKKHEHSNKVELDKFVDGDKKKWDDHVADTNIHVTAKQKTDWQNATDAINAFLAAEGNTTEAIDTLKEIQDFLTSDDGTVETLLGKIDSIEKSLVEDGDTYEAIAAAQADVDALEIAVGAGFSESKTVASEIARVEGIADAAQTAQEVSDAIDAKINGLGGSDEGESHGVKVTVASSKGEVSSVDVVVTGELSEFVSGDKAKWDGHVANADIHVTTADKANWNVAVQTVSVAEGCEMLSATKDDTTVTLALYYGGDDAEE